jgi:Ca2+-binding EF-hand superfamily protein
MKKIFMDRDIESDHRERLVKMDRQFSPTDSARLSSMSSESNSSDTSSPSSISSNSFRGVEFGDKLKNLKVILLQNMGRVHSEGSRSSELRILHGEIDLPTYCQMMVSVDLHVLATEEVFTIFDINRDGKIELKEFLLTLTSFRAPDHQNAAELYFNLFDLNEDGFIDVEELRAVVACLLHDGSGPLLPEGLLVSLTSVEELFDVIDCNPKDGKIDIEEFKNFYHTVLLPTVSRRVSSVHPNIIS